MASAAWKTAGHGRWMQQRKQPLLFGLPAFGDVDDRLGVCHLSYLWGRESCPESCRNPRPHWNECIILHMWFLCITYVCYVHLSVRFRSVFSLSLWQTSFFNVVKKQASSGSTSTTEVHGEMTLDEPLTETGRWQAESVRQQLIVGSLLQRQKKIKILLPRMQGVMILHIIHIGFCTYTYI